MLSSKKNGTMTRPWISTHHKFILGLSLSCSIWSLEGSLPQMTQLCRLTRINMWNFAWSLKKIRLKKLSSSRNCGNMCATNCNLSCFSRPLILWTTCDLCEFRRRLFRRILWTAVCGICNSAFAREVDVFGLRVKACLTQCTSSWDLLGHPSSHCRPV
jgi:hypothetical protein